MPGAQSAWQGTPEERCQTAVAGRCRHARLNDLLRLLRLTGRQLLLTGRQLLQRGQDLLQQVVNTTLWAGKV